MSISEFAKLFDWSRQRGYQVIAENPELVASRGPTGRITLDVDAVHRWVVRHVGAGR